MNNFTKLHSAFSEVSKVFKAGNYSIFNEELVKKMADLKYTKEFSNKVQNAEKESEIFTNSVVKLSPNFVSPI